MPGNCCVSHLSFMVVAIMLCLSIIEPVSARNLSRNMRIYSLNFIESVIYFQESLLSVPTTSSSYWTAQISSQCSSCGVTSSFGISVWVKKTAWSDFWDLIFRVANDPG